MFLGFEEGEGNPASLLVEGAAGLEHDDGAGDGGVEGVDVARDGNVDARQGRVLLVVVRDAVVEGLADVLGEADLGADDDGAAVPGGHGAVGVADRSSSRGGLLLILRRWTDVGGADRVDAPFVAEVGLGEGPVVEVEDGEAEGGAHGGAEALGREGVAGFGSDHDCGVDGSRRGRAQQSADVAGVRDGVQHEHEVGLLGRLDVREAGQGDGALGRRRVAARF
mmetsp:Transcript_22659/g.69666  ORF Transcript_22659/g.69666 Transcript_22659/m.69666 type:complete len:223 (-) Transcript_22659:315-983(-)